VLSEMLSEMLSEVLKLEKNGKIGKIGENQVSDSGDGDPGIRLGVWNSSAVYSGRRTIRSSIEARNGGREQWCAAGSLYPPERSDS
jgi:hypothetical protein